MSLIKHKEISHRDFSSRFKLIRHARDNHFGDHALMKDSLTKRRAIVKKHQYEDLQQLRVIVADYQRLCQMHQKSQSICEFLGFCLEENRGVQSIHLIYDYHQSTLEEEIKSMTLHKQKFTEKDIQIFLNQMTKALGNLQEFSFNHLTINYNYVLLQNRNAIDQKYKLLFSPFLAGAVQQIKESGGNVEDYNLSEIQLKQINEQKFDDEDLPFSQKLRIDKQSLGIMALRMATLDCPRQRIYEMNERYELVWDAENLKLRLDLLNQNFPKKIGQRIEYLIFDHAFYSFKDIPIFASLDNSHLHSHSRSQKNYDSLSKSRRGVKVHSKSPDRYKNISDQKQLNESRLSRINEQSYLGAVLKLNPDSLDTSKNNLTEVLEKNHSPSKQKLNKYESILYEIETYIFSQLDQKSKHKVDLADGSTYIGSFKGKKKDGLGICYFKDGDVYAGQWIDDNMEGSGTYLFRNNSRYVGQVKNGFKHGHGKYIFMDGSYYEGEWKSDKKDGFGTYHYKNGQKYEGIWKSGQRNGQGIYTWKNGDKYEGSFQKGLKNGRGIVVKSDGSKIIGNWKNDHLQGIADIKFVSGSEYTGQVNQLLYLHGQGQEITAQGVHYQGQFFNNKKNGKCKITFPNGDIYEGLMRNDKFEGFGTYFYSYMKCTYVGDWKQGMQNGSGKLKFENGTQIQCKWRYGKPEKEGRINFYNGDEYLGEINGLGCNGKGKYMHRNGRVVQGMFKNGVLINY